MYFENIEKIKYEGVNSKNPLSFKYYDADKMVAGKTMREHLKFAMSYWHTMLFPSYQRRSCPPPPSLPSIVRLLP